MILDLTHTMNEEMSLYPGTPAPAFQPVRKLTRDGFRETQLQLTSHTGTHMDAPSHLLSSGSTLDELPVSQFCGRAAVVDVSHVGPTISAEFLQAQNGTIRSADFVLFYTGWEKRWGTPGYLEDGFPVPDAEAARYLVSCGLKGVGTDAVSIDALADITYTAHRILLQDMVVIESLCLKKLLGRNTVMFYALPLKYTEADGAPVRAIADLREIEREEGADA